NLADLIRQSGQIKRSQQIKNRILDVVEQTDLSSISEINIQLLDFKIAPLAVNYQRQSIADSIKRYITSLRCVYHLDLLSSSEISRSEKRGIANRFLNDYINAIALNAYKELHGDSNIAIFEKLLEIINRNRADVVTAYESVLNNYIDLLIQYSDDDYELIFNYPQNRDVVIQTIHHISPYWAMEFHNSRDCQVQIGILYLVAMCYDSISFDNPLTEGLMTLTEDEDLSISQEGLEEVCNNLIKLQPKAKRDIEDYRKI
ncbi:MAG: hypothetical protein ACI4SH_01045, partial [Candidatus Scatosoma sp.]